MGINEQVVAHQDFIDRDVCMEGICAMSYLGHALGQGVQYGRRATRSVGLQRLTSGQHQNDDCGDPILSQDQRCCDREESQDINAEISIENLSTQRDEQRSAGASDSDHKNDVLDVLTVQQELH